MGFDEYQKSDNAMCMNNDYNRKIYEAGAASRQADVDELQKRIDLALSQIESKQDESWRNWKESADMMEQGASNAYEVAYWILKGKKDE